MEIKKHNNRWFEVIGVKGRREKLDVLISNDFGVWEKITAVRDDCASCCVRKDGCAIDGCFLHKKINETTSVKKIGGA